MAIGINQLLVQRRVINGKYEHIMVHENFI